MAGLRPGQDHLAETMSPASPQSPSPSLRRVTRSIVVLAKALASLVLFLLCTVGVGDLCFPVLRSGDASRGFQTAVVAAHVLAGAVFVEGMRALWGRAVARIVCAIGFAWFLLLLVTAGFDPQLPGIFGAIFGILALYYPFRLVLLCRRPRPAMEPSARPS